MHAEAIFCFLLDPSQWPAVIPLALGGLLALGVFLWGNAFFARRRAAPPDTGPEAVPAEPSSIRQIIEKDPFLHGSGRERRQALRRGGNPVSVLISDAAAQADPWFGRVVDRSMGGLCLEVEEVVPEGTILSVRAEKAVALLPWAQVRVKSCRQAGGRYSLGCQFVRTPASTVLWSFG